MAIFGFKKTSGDPDKPGAANGEDARPPDLPYQVNAENARKFFLHARSKHETANYEYAMKLWLDGLRQDAASMEGVEGFFESARHFAAENKKGPSKEISRTFGGRGDLEKYLAALLECGSYPLDSVAVVRSADYASRLGLAEITYALAERAMVVLSKDPKGRKDLYLKVMEVCGQVNAFDLAVRAGEAACRLDPTDGKLAAEVRNLAAQATMSRGGYDKSGQAGGFRSNIRDADKQRMLEEQERIVKTEETIDRLLKGAEDDYQKRPDDAHAINLYLKRLMERGRPEDEKRARNVAKDAFAKTKQFRFRQIEGDIVLRWYQRKLQEYKDAAAKSPDDANAQAQLRAATIQFAKKDIEELKLRVEAYPTDLGLKYELGKRHFELERYDDAIGMFQEAKADAKIRVPALTYLAQSFQRIEWVAEAVQTFRRAREAHPVENDEMGMSIQYGLMTALQAQGEKERDLAVAEEADRLASTIAIQQINYRDIRLRRDAIKKLVAELKKGAAA